MELAKISSKGQITIPIAIRKKLNLKEFQNAMVGEAKKQKLKSEEDINKMVKETRRELWEEKYEDNE